jgi:antibiotic biosynthesis monooxygenase (ABM) superfamily enzyme
MFGTIMRAKLKPGQKDAYQRWGQEQQSQLTQPGTSGFVSIEIAFEDKDPNRIVTIVRFTDRDTYVKNAKAPATNDNYNQMVKFFEGPPEWIDVNYVAFAGEPLKPCMASPQAEPRRA